MFPLLLYASLLSGDAETRAVQFILCETYHYHVAVKRNEDNYLVHFHVSVTECPKNRVFARLRCRREFPAGKVIVEHLDTKIVTVKKNDRWFFFLTAPRFENEGTDIRYQIEIGYVDPKDINEFIITDSFAWVIDRGKMSTKVDQERIQIPVEKKVIAMEGDKFVVKSVYQTALREDNMRYGLTERLPKKVEGEKRAMRDE